MSKHTPLPYALCWEDGKHGVIGTQTDGKLIAIVGNNPGDDKNDERKANAEFFVRACNSHYELLKALKHISDPEDCGCVPCRGQCESEEALKITIEGLKEIASDAIAKATGAS